MLPFLHEIGEEDLWPEEDPAVHVKLSPTGAWHRITVDVGRVTSDLWIATRSKATTACGQPVSGYYSLREESYAGTLCTQCFHQHELTIAQEIVDRDRGGFEEEADAWRDEQDRHRRERDDMHARNREALAIATGKVPKLVIDDDDEKKKPDED